ncbi:MAG: RnfH family protein [Gammaproteobacteria bacterium]
MASAETLCIEVVYASADAQQVATIMLAAGADVRAAIEGSGLLQQFPGIDLACNRVGIFGRLVRLDTVLSSGDRVEIYRPLLKDPKEARRERATRNANTGKHSR